MRLSADGWRSGHDDAGSAAILASALCDESGRRCSTFPNPDETGWDADLQTSRRAASELSHTAQGEAAKQDSSRMDEQKGRVDGEPAEKIQEQGSHLCHTGGFVFLRLLEGMQRDAGPSGADVASLVENCPYSESFMSSVVPLPLHMLWEQGGRQNGGWREDGFWY